MNIAKKAALFSALLFPGWGQIYLKRYKRGAAIIFAVLAGSLSLVWSVVQIAIAILKVSPFKKGTIQISDVLTLTSKAVRELDMFYMTLPIILLTILWIFSTVDAYWLGKKEMARTAASTIAADQQSISPVE